MVEHGIKFSFELTKRQGAALVTKYSTYRQEIQMERTFEKYIKQHYDSWVAFARKNGHGDNVGPILVTGVDMTRDFAMMCYSDASVSVASEFTASVSKVASTSSLVWGSWHKEGLVHTNCGPHNPAAPSRIKSIFRPSPKQRSSSTQSVDSKSSVPKEYNQCVFLRYYTIQKRLGIPRVIKAGAGPHDLGPGDRKDEGSPRVEAQPDLDSGSDIIPNLRGDGGDDFDAIADYIFQAS